MTTKIAGPGLGSVGKGVLETITRKDLDIIVTGVADSKSGLIDPLGLDIGAVLLSKRTGQCGDSSVSAKMSFQRQIMISLLK